MLKLGIYRHYKGNTYELCGTAQHSETLEVMALYKPLYNDSGWWVRPLAMFQENVTVNGVEQPRFAYISALDGTI